MQFVGQFKTYWAKIEQPVWLPDLTVYDWLVWLICYPNLGTSRTPHKSCKLWQGVIKSKLPLHQRVCSDLWLMFPTGSWGCRSIQTRMKEPVRPFQISQFFCWPIQLRWLCLSTLKSTSEKLFRQFLPRNSDVRSFDTFGFATKIVLALLCWNIFWSKKV